MHWQESSVPQSEWPTSPPILPTAQSYVLKLLPSQSGNPASCWIFEVPNRCEHQSSRIMPSCKEKRRDAFGFRENRLNKLGIRGNFANAIRLDYRAGAKFRMR